MIAVVTCSVRWYIYDFISVMDVDVKVSNLFSLLVACTLFIVCLINHLP